MGLLSAFGLVRASEAAALAARVEVLETRALQDRAARAEIASGVKMTLGAFTYEHNAAIAGTAKWATFDRMESDPHVKGNLNAKILPLLTAEWAIEPASDDARDQEIAEFVSANLLGKGGDIYGEDYYSQTSWEAQRLPETLDMIRAGYALFADSTRIVNGLRVFDRMQWLEPASVDPHGWELADDDSIVRIARTYQKPSARYEYREALPLDQIALFVWELKGARFEGRSAFRSAWGPWFRKEFIQKQAMMWAQRVGAPRPHVRVPQNITPDDMTMVEEFADSLLGTDPDVGFLVTRDGADGQGVSIQYAGAQAGEVDRMRGLIDGENSELAKVGGSQMSQLAESKTGSRALAEPIGRLETLQVQAIAEVICCIEQRGVANLMGRIPRLVRWNFANVKKMPWLKCSKINPSADLQDLPGLLEWVKAGVIPRHPSVAREIASRYGVELPDEVYDLVESGPVVPPQPTTGKSNEVSDVGGENEQQAYAASLSIARNRITALLQPAEGGAPIGAGFRAPNRFEVAYCKLGEILDSFRVGERDILQELRVIREAMVKDLMRRLRAGQITRESAERLWTSRFRETAKYTARLLDLLRGVGTKGREHVRGEIERQRERRAA